MRKFHVKLGLLLLISLTLMGCGSKELEITPQKFVYNYEETKERAAYRQHTKIAKRIIPSGTVFPIRTLNQLSSRTSRTGDIFRIEALQDVVIDGVVVLPVGSIGQGRVTNARKGGMMGKGGDLEIRFDFISTYDGTIVPIEWTEAAGMQDKGISFAEVFFLGVFSLLKTGDNIVLPADSQFYVLTKAPTEVSGRRYGE